MRLLYLYLKNYGCFKDQEFNFDSRIRFYLKTENEDSYFLECTEDKTFPEDFYSTDGKSWPIECISAIVGENGSGKTTIAKAISKLSENINHMFEHVIVYEYTDLLSKEKQLVCQYHLLKKITSGILLNHLPVPENENSDSIKISTELYEKIKEYIPSPYGTGTKKFSDLPVDDPIYKQVYDFFVLDFSGGEKNCNRLIQEISCNLRCNLECNKVRTIPWEAYNFSHQPNMNFTFVYYSPVYTTESINLSTETIDISTTKCLQTGPGTRWEYYQNLSFGTGMSPQIAHRAYEYKWLLKFLSVIREKCNNDPTIIDDFKDVKGPLGLNISVEKDLLKISEKELIKMREEYKKGSSDYDSEIITEKDNNQYGFYDRIVKAIVKARTEDFFVNAFIASFASFCRDHLKGSVEVGTPSAESYFKKAEIYCEFIEKMENDMPPFQTKENMKSVYTKILDFLQKTDSLLYNLFTLLKCAYTDYIEPYIIKKTPPFVQCPCASEDEIKKVIKITEAYFKCGYITNFLKFTFEPVISSGEMAFYTTFSRFYEKIQDHNNSLGNDLLIFLDEVETTLHPSWQLKLIYLLKRFFEIFTPEKRVHLLFSSHSPMLLSDIPKGNAIFLKKIGNQGKAIPVSTLTFGGQIYDLYKNSFFLYEGTIGKFASEILQTLLNVVNKEESELQGKEKELFKKREKFNNYVNLIGDNYIREYLLRKYAEKCCKGNLEKIVQYQAIIDSLNDNAEKGGKK